MFYYCLQALATARGRCSHGTATGRTSRVGVASGRWIRPQHRGALFSQRGAAAHAHIRTCARIHAHTPPHTTPHTRARMHTHTHPRMHTPTHTHTHTHAHAHARTCTTRACANNRHPASSLHMTALSHMQCTQQTPIT